MKQRITDQIVEMREDMGGADRLEPAELDSAIVGTTDEDRFVYSVDLLLPLLPGSSREEQLEFFEHNTLKALQYMGERPPVILWPVHIVRGSL